MMRILCRATISSRLLLASCWLLFAALLFAGCGAVSARATATHAPATQAPTATATLLPVATPARTPSAGCAAIGSQPGMATALTLPLPPHTVSDILPSAAGAGFYLECTPGATQSSITTYLNQAFPQAGWQKWNPQTDNAYGCGSQPNSYWQWSDGKFAVGWDFQGEGLPKWHLTVCSLAYR